MLSRLVLIHGAACNADSQRSESQFECVWDVFTGHVGASVCPQPNVLVLAQWCKTVINVCSLSLSHIFSRFVPQLSPFFNNSPPSYTLAISPSINLSTSSVILSFHIVCPAFLSFIVSSDSLSFSSSYRHQSWGWHQRFISTSSPPW